MKRALLVLALGVAALGLAAADDMSGDDKLRLLYSHRFSFDRRGVPLVTVALMEGQSAVTLWSEAGLDVLPDGDGGARVEGGRRWTVTLEGGRPAKVVYWTIVSRQATDADVAAWRGRGLEVKTFETGIVFGVEGDIIDSRETLLGVAPAVDHAAAARTAAEIAAKHGVTTSTHPEIVARAEGTVVAREASSGAVVRNSGALWFAPRGGLVTVGDVVFGGGGAKEDARQETRSYHGQVYVTVGRDGALTVVNSVAEDDLLAGLLPSEIYPDAGREALRAQAVAARTELLARVGTRHFEDPYLLCSTQHCQVYAGAGVEDKRTTQAVADTAGQLLLRDGGGGLVPTYYSADCGGHGEHNENVWGTPPDPSLRGHLDAVGADAKALARFAGGITDKNLADFLAAPEKASCGQGKRAKDRYRWSVRLAAAEVDRLVAASHPTVGEVRELVALARGVSGRVRTLRIVGSKGTVEVHGELVIRRLFGGLKSSLFLVKAERSGKAISAWVFDGAGFGHGVGLCQLGAAGMAAAGHTYAKILGHYYPGSHVRRIY